MGPSVQPRRSLVIPVYLNAPNIVPLVDVVEQLSSDLDHDLEIVFVIDGSPDDSLAILTRELSTRRSFEAQIVVHSRNFGSFAAIRTGLAAARGEWLAVMAADLQEPIDLVEQFFALLERDEADVVVGTRAGRDDGAMKDVMSNAYWSLARRIISAELPRGGVDVFACNAQVRDALLAMREQHTSLVGQLYWLGFRRAEIPYERRAREAGESGWSFRRKVNYLMDSFFSFTDLPIRAITFVGMLGFIIAAVLSVAVVVGRAFEIITVPGYAATVLVVVGFAMLNLLCLGIVANYVYRTYENTKGRPLALQRTALEFSREASHPPG